MMSTEERKTIYLCLAHMSKEGWEQKYVKEAFDTNWVVPMGPNVNELGGFCERLFRWFEAGSQGGVFECRNCCRSLGIDCLWREGG